ncbi:MAG: type II secretion system protein [Candidatus Omnitrophota bacterium]
MFKKKCAYTLVELLVSLAIFSIVIGSLLTILISQNNFFSRASARMDVGVTARKVMDNMIKELRSSKLDEVIIYNIPMDQGGVLDYTDALSINFRVPVDFDSDGDVFDNFGRIEWGTEEELDGSIEYFWDSANDRVIRRLWDSTGVSNFESVIAENITDFRINAFSYAGGGNLVPATVNPNDAFAPEIVTIAVTAQRDTVGGRVLAVPLTYTLTNSVTWRN